MKYSTILLAAFIISFGAIGRAQQWDDLRADQFLKTLLAIDPSKLENPARFKRMRDLVKNFSTCIKDGKKSKYLNTVICKSLMFAELEKLDRNLKDIDEATFTKQLREKVLKDLTKTYADLAYRYRSKEWPNDSKDLCDLIGQDLKTSSPCNEDDAKFIRNSYSEKIAELRKQNLPDLEGMEKDYNNAVARHLEMKTYLSKCEKIKKELEANEHKGKDVSIQLINLKTEIAQVVRSQAISKVRVNEHPLALLLKTDHNLESEVIESINPLSLPFEESKSRSMFGIRSQISELIGLGDKLNSSSAQLVNYATAQEVATLKFYLDNYPVELGSLIGQYPHMAKKVCDLIAQQQDQKDNKDYIWGNSIVESKVIAPDLINSTVAPQANSIDDQRVLQLLKEDQITCNQIEKHYGERKTKATDAEYLKKEHDYLNSFRRFAEVSGIYVDGMTVMSTMRLSVSCKGEYVNAYKIDMMDKAIRLNQKIEKDPELQKLLYQFMRKYDQKDPNDDFSGSKRVNALLAVFARLPESKIDDKPVQGEELEKLKKALRTDLLQAVNSKVAESDITCPMSIPVRK